MGHAKESGAEGRDHGHQYPRSVAVKWLEAALTLIGGIAVFAMMILSVGDAALRSLFNAPIFGANDYTKVILAFSVAVSLPLCILAGRAITIDTLVRQLPPSIGRALHWLVSGLGAFMLFYVAWRCYLNGRDAAMFGETTMLLRLPLGPSYYILSVGMILSGFLLLLVKPAHGSNP
ncbi:MAG: TRAP transporter small permease [Stappiaceae bacterium]